jgi:hypothetical protein
MKNLLAVLALFGAASAFAQSPQDESLPLVAGLTPDRKVSFLNYGTTPLALAANEAQRSVIGRVLREMAKDRRQVEKGDPTYKTPWEVEFSSQSRHFSSDLISLVQTGYAFTGGAHQTNCIEGMVFYVDHRNGAIRRATHKNLLTNWEVRYRVAAQLLMELRDDGASFYGDPPMTLSEDLMDNFYVTKEGVTWIFPHYTVGPYAEGARTVFLTWDQLGQGVNSALRPASIW